MNNMNKTNSHIDNQDRNLAVLMHIGTIVAAFSGGLATIVVPLIALLVFGGRSPFLREHIVEQLNFQLMFFVVAWIGVALSVLTLGLVLLFLIPLLLLLGLIDVVGSVKAALHARDGESYRFPTLFRLFR
jgi:uncharacterized protein